MVLLRKEEVVDIYNLFLSKLSKLESTFLLGLYYSEQSSFTEEEIDKYLIIAQQLLTFLKRNRYPETKNNETIEKLFYDLTDEIDSNTHPDYMIGKDDKLDVEKIQQAITIFNQYVAEPISLIFVPKPEETIVEKTEEPKKEIEEVIDDTYTIGQFQKDTFYKYLSCFPPLKKTSGRQRKILQLGVGTGYFTSLFIKEKFLTYVVDEDSSKIQNLKFNPLLKKMDTDYMNCFSDESIYDGIWSFNSIMHMKKSEIVKTIENIDKHLKLNGYAFLSFFYGTNHKTINGKYNTLFDEDSFSAVISTNKNLMIDSIWNSTYVAKDNESYKRLNVIIKKISTHSSFGVYTANEDTELLPDSIDIQKLQILSTCNENLKLGTEILQKITLSKNGNLLFWRYKSLGQKNSKPTYELIERQNLKLDKDTTEKLFFLIYRSVFFTELDMNNENSGWDMTISAVNKDIYKASGSYKNRLTYNEIDVCKYLLETINIPGLWALGGNNV